MRWEEERDPDRPLTPRRWGVAVAIAGLGVALVAGAALYPASPPPAGSGTVAVQAVDEPTGRGGLPHRVAAPSTQAPAPLVAPQVAEAAATAPATSAAAPAPAATPPVGRVGQPCDVPGATGVSADGGPLVCRGGKGNDSARWRKG